VKTKLLVFSTVLAVLCLLWNYFLDARWQSPHSLFVVVYFFITAALAHNILVKASAQSPQIFVRTYMTLTGLRLFLNLIVIAIYLVVNKAGGKSFVLAFLLIYFSFLIFEVINTQKDLKKK
jgi:hypothetical protein